jgi:hypothetical protein
VSSRGRRVAHAIGQMWADLSAFARGGPSTASWRCLGEPRKMSFRYLVIAMSYSVTAGRGVGWGFILLAVCILGLGGALRCHALGGRSLWSDEYLSLECSAGRGRSDLRVASSHAAAPDLLTLGHAGPWTDVWSSIARDENHPPLYFLLLRGWRMAVGDSAVAVRSLSVLASLVAVGLTMAAGTEAFGPAAGLWAGLLMAVATPQLREAQDARAYMPVTAVAAWALLLLVRTDRRGPTWPRAAALFVALLALPLLHYMALATVGAVVVYAALGMRGPARRATLGAAAAALGTYVACWGPHLVGQHQRMLDATVWLIDGDAGHLARTALNLLAAPVRLLIEPKYSGAAAVGGLAILSAPPLCAWAARRTAAAPEGRRLVLLWLWLGVPVGVAAVIDLATARHSLDMAKYTLAAAPGLYLMIAAVAATGRRLAWVPAAAIALACLAFLPNVYHPAEPDWRELARAVADRTRPGDPVVLVAPAADDDVSGMRVVGLQYCLAQLGAPRDVYVLADPPRGPALDALRRARRACVIGNRLGPATNDLLSGLAIDRAELFVGLGILGTADRPALPPLASAR